MKKTFGVDIGATGIKGGIVDIETASLIQGRHRVLTPQPSLPLDILDSVQNLIDFYQWEGPIGLGFPATFINGICMTAVNIDPAWKGMNAVEFFSKNLNRKVFLGNDADVAGLAEFYANDSLTQYEKVLFLTLGTGIGSAFIYKGELIPNFEMGQLKWKKDIIEKYSSNKARTDNKLTWEQFGKRLQKTLKYYNLVLSPDIIVLGGGISKKMDQYEAFLDLPIPIVPAQLKNNAGIIGAALLTI